MPLDRQNTRSLRRTNDGDDGDRDGSCEGTARCSWTAAVTTSLHEIKYVTRYIPGTHMSVTCVHITHLLRARDTT